MQEFEAERRSGAVRKTGRERCDIWEQQQNREFSGEPEGNFFEVDSHPPFDRQNLGATGNSVGRIHE